MAFEKIASLDAETQVNLGGINKKTGKPNPKSVEGYYLGTKTGIPNKFNPEKPDCQHVFQTEKGTVGVWGKSHMDPQMAKAIPGCMVRVTFTGTRPSKKGNDQLLFSVEQDKTNNLVGFEAVTFSDSGAEPDYSDSGDTGHDFGGQEDDTTEDTAPIDEPPAQRPQPPRQAAKAPDAARQAQVQALLNKSRAAKTA